jgi:hypothetical protein
MKSYFPLEDVYSGESCSGGIRIAAERGIFRRANCLVFAPAVFKNMQNTSKSALLAKSHLDGRHFEKF